MTGAAKSVQRYIFAMRRGCNYVHPWGRTHNFAVARITTELQESHTYSIYTLTDIHYIHKQVCC